MFETGRERRPNKLWRRNEYEEGRGDGICKSFHAVNVIAIAMGRCAGGTQQVLVPLYECVCLLQLKIQGRRLGQSRSEVQIHSW